MNEDTRRFARKHGFRHIYAVDAKTKQQVLPGQTVTHWQSGQGIFQEVECFQVVVNGRRFNPSVWGLEVRAETVEGKKSETQRQAPPRQLRLRGGSPTD